MDAGLFEWVIGGLVAIIGAVGIPVVGRIFNKLDEAAKERKEHGEKIARLEGEEKGRNGTLKAVQTEVKVLGEKVEQQGKLQVETNTKLDNLIEVVSHLRSEPKPRGRKR